jgi:hypothetical protein
MGNKALGVHALLAAVTLSAAGCDEGIWDGGGDPGGDVAGGDIVSLSSAVSAQNPADTGVGLSVSVRTFAGFANCGGLISCDGFAPPVAARPPKRTRGSNSQHVIPNNTLFADVDGDRQADFIQYDNVGRLFAHRANFDRAEIHHLFFPSPIQQVITGDFYGVGWDQVCVINSQGLSCYGIDVTRDDQFRLFFKQPNPIGASEDVIVGDYDGDKKDSLLLYDRVAGAYRMLDFQAGAGFVPHPNWSKGNLNRILVPGLQLRAGDWSGDGRTDLLVKTNSGQVQAYAAATGQAGQNTFHWAFDSNSGVVASGELFFLARVDDDAKDDLVRHNVSTGVITFHKVQFNNGQPPVLPMVMGNLPTTPNSHLVMAWSHPMHNEPGVENRDDPFLFFENNTRIRGHEARYDQNDAHHTYWLEYTINAPNNHTGWPARSDRKTLFLKCKLNGDTSEPRAAIFPALIERIRDYFFEVTYGRVNLYDAEGTPSQWTQMPLTRAEYQAMGEAENILERAIIGRECARAAGKNPSDWKTVVSFVNSSVDWGQNGRYATISGGSNGSVYDVWATVHEIGHSLGLDHTANNNADDSTNPYGNPWDPMSARTTGYTYTNPLGRPEGPELTSGNRSVLGAIPDRRISFVPFGGASRTVILSALNRPATPHFLQIQLKMNDSADPDAYKSVEYREPSGFDSGIARPTVLVHRVRPGSNKVRLQMDDPAGFSRWSSAERLEGESYTNDDIGTIRVVKIDPVRHRAEIELTPVP